MELKNQITKKKKDLAARSQVSVLGVLVVLMRVPHMNIRIQYLLRGQISKRQIQSRVHRLKFQSQKSYMSVLHLGEVCAQQQVPQLFIAFFFCDEAWCLKNLMGFSNNWDFPNNPQYPYVWLWEGLFGTSQFHYFAEFSFLHKWQQFISADGYVAIHTYILHSLMSF